MKETGAVNVESPLMLMFFYRGWIRRTGRWSCCTSLIGLLVLNIGPVRLSSAPVASPNLAFHPIDLGPFYSLRFPTKPAGRLWSRLPRGLQTLANVPFLVEGKLELTGMDAARAGAYRPPRITGIPVSRTASRLHLLHGAAHGGKDGVPLGQMVLHYTNGEMRSFRIAYGVHGRNWIREPGERQSTLDDPHSAVAWSSPARDGDEPAGRFRFFRTTFSNPLPDREIASIDFVSFFNKATPIVFALTIEQGGAPGAEPDSARIDLKAIRDATAYDESVYVGTMGVRVLHAADGSPLTNGTVNVTLSDGGPPFFFGEYPMDLRGSTAFWYPAQHAVTLHVQARSPGFTPVLTSIQRGSTESFPREIETRLSRGRVGGGVIRSALGPAVSNACILIVRDQLWKPGEFMAIAWDRITSHAGGRWTSDALPADLSGFRLQLSHPGYEPVTYAVAPPGSSNAWSVSSDDFLSTNAVLLLKPRLRVSGQVLEPAGQLATNANGLFLPLSRDRSRFNPERDGRLSPIVPEPGRAYSGGAGPGRCAAVGPLHPRPRLGAVADHHATRMVLGWGAGAHFLVARLVRVGKGSADAGAASA